MILSNARDNALELLSLSRFVLSISGGFMNVANDYSWAAGDENGVTGNENDSRIGDTALPDRSIGL